MGDDPIALLDLRGRLGYTVAPNVLLYATGGGAVLWQKREGYLLPLFANIASITNTSYPATLGWTAGGGAEYAVNQNWILRAEYLYYGFPSATTVSTCSKCTPGAFNGNGAFGYGQYTINEVRLGASYKF
jgi:outer membrane immunogenic protein